MTRLIVTSARRTASRALLAIAIFGLSGGVPRPAQAENGTKTVTIRELKFSPEKVEIAAGQEVEWKNADVVPHTVSAPDAGVDSGILNPGQAWRHRFKAKGEVHYVCTLHPSMKASIVVH